MPLAFSFPAVVIKKERLLKQYELHLRHKDISDFSKHLLSSNLQDDFLIGIESMSNTFDVEIEILTDMGLQWNSGNQAIDFYITNRGNFTANWLAFARITEHNEKLNSFFSVYKHTLDENDKNQSFDGCLKSQFPNKNITLDRFNWGKIAKEEGNKLYQPTIDEFINEVTKNNRVCPNPNLWNHLHTLAIESTFGNHKLPNLPLILSAWWDTSDVDKAQRLKELIDWCYKTNVSDVAWAFLKMLNESEWHHKY